MFFWIIGGLAALVAALWLLGCIATACSGMLSSYKEDSPHRMTFLRKFLRFIRIDLSHQNPVLREPNKLTTEEEAREKLRQVAEVVKFRRICENAAYLINERTLHGSIGIERIAGNDEQARKFAPEKWLKIDSVIRINLDGGKTIDLVMMELKNWMLSPRDKSESGSFYIFYAGEKVFESLCVRKEMGWGERGVAIHGEETFIKCFINGEWVAHLEAVVSNGERLKEKWKRDSEENMRKDLVDRANKMKL